MFVNTNIPSDVVNEHIFTYLKICDLLKVGLLQKELYEIHKIILLEKIKLIQKNVKYYRIPDNYGDSNYTGTNLSWGNFYNYQKILSRKIFYRKLIVHMNMHFLQGYPIFLLNKTMTHGSSRYMIVKDWMNRYYPKIQYDATRRDVLNFFVENRITVDEIMYAGW